MTVPVVTSYPETAEYVKSIPEFADAVHHESYRGLTSWLRRGDIVIGAFGLHTAARINKLGGRTFHIEIRSTSVRRVNKETYSADDLSSVPIIEYEVRRERKWA